MIECPVCGFNPDPVETPATEAELKHRRLLSIFSKNLQNSWWLTQPEFVCKWLSDNGISPKRLIDLGCGDGRFIPGIFKTWPSVEYVGIDAMQEHIDLNRESFPDLTFDSGDFCQSHYNPGWFDTFFMMGIFNPKMDRIKQNAILDKVVWLKPENVVCLFDNNSSGEKPHDGLMGYSQTNVLYIPQDLQGPKQGNVVWLWKRQSY